MSVSQSLTVTEVANSQSIDKNTSKVRILWTSTQAGESWNGYTRTAYYYVSVNGGTETKYSVSYTLPKGSTKTIVDTTLTVSHNSDGSGTVKVRTWMDTDIAQGVIEKTASLTLSTIPRASTIDSLSCATNYFTGTMTYKYTPKSSSMYNRCNISLNISGTHTAVKSINIGKKAASQQTATVTLTSTELATIYNKLPSATKGVIRFTFYTYSDSAYSKAVGSSTYKELTLSIPNNSTTQPSVSMTLSVVSSLASPFNAMYIQGKSKVKATISATLKNNATISAYSMSVGGASYGSNVSYTSALLSSSGNVSVIGYAKDSRGFTGSNTQSITVYAYDKPKIKPVSGESEVIAARCDKNGNFTDSGTYLKIRAKRSFSSVNSKNTCSIRFRYKAENATSFSAWTTILSGTASGNEVTTSALLSGGLSATTTYIVEVGVIDALGETGSTTITVPTEKVYMHRDGARNSFAFGGYVEEDNTFSIAPGINFKVKHDSGLTTVVDDTGWIDLGLSSNVSEGTEVGRNGKGCYYRVINGNHVYVAFNCAFEYAGSSININNDAIPSKYRPANHAYALVPTTGRCIARIVATTTGRVSLEWFQRISSAEETTSATVSWIDGYIDYWI